MTMDEINAMIKKIAEENPEMELCTDKEATEFFEKTVKDYIDNILAAEELRKEYKYKNNIICGEAT